MESFFTEFRLYAMVALGIGLVIFVHELGHFLAARWCGVRVDTFSLGFGPRLFGWRRGATMYQLSLVPLGGYVKMAGEEVAPGRPAGSDELPSKSVGQRFLIFSGGVIMNVIFALVVFPIILMVGVPMPSPQVGDLVPGGPAWNAGVVPGSKIVSVNGTPVKSFGDIPQTVALGSPEYTDLVLIEPGQTEPRTVRLTPKYDEDMGFYTIGVASNGADPASTIEVLPGSAAEKAGMKTGDRAQSVVGALPGLRLEEQLASASQSTLPLKVVVTRADGTTFEAEVAPATDAKGRGRMGFQPCFQVVKALRPGPLVAATGLETDDRLLAVDDQPVHKMFDSYRALLAASADGNAMRVLRDERIIELPNFALTAGDALALHRDIAIMDDKVSRVVVVPGGLAAEDAGLRTNDRIVKIGESEIAKFEDIIDANKKTKEGQAVGITVERLGAEGATETLSLSVTPRPLAQPNWGFGLRDATYIYKAETPIEAARVGFSASWKFAVESWLTLKRILLGQVSGKNIGGIITIGVVSHSRASDGITKLLFFLCMLSMNLAFLNVLPIPVLDGGHLFFLLVEKLKGSPVSERVLAHSQMVGVVLIGSLMVYVTFNDIRRWIF